MHMWSWDWGWGWAATVGAILLLGIFLIPWFFFLLNLNNLLERVKEHNRAMPPSYVWLNFIPLFCLGWFLYTVIKVRDSVRAEYGARGWPADGDFGYNVGIAAGVLWIAAFFFWWIPFIGWLLGIGWLVCWIIYWLKTSDLRKRLDETAAWRGPAAYPPYPATPPPYGGASPYAPPAQPARPDVFATGPGASAAPPAAGAAPVTAAAAGSAAAAAAGAAAEPPEQPAPEGETRRKMCMVCGAPYDQGDKFCRSCGLPLP